MPLNNYQKMCYRWFGRAAESVVTDKMKLDLERAHITIRPGAYISCMWVNTLLVAVVTAIVYMTLVLFIGAEIWLAFILAIIPVMATGIAYMYFKTMPSSRAGQKIRLRQPHRG